MPVPDLYIRPTGFAWVPDRERIAELVGALPLAGHRHLDFMGVEVLERQPTGGVSLRAASIAELNERDWGRHAVEASGFFSALVMPRRAFAGLPMNQTHVMGIVNVTPDSFSDGGRYASVEAAISHGLRLVAEGATIVDVGGESTRPGAEPVPLADELARVLPVIEGLAERTEARISIDTRKAEVMRRAVEAGADIVNDVSALTYDPEALAAVAELAVPVVLVHALGDPRTMQHEPRYDHVLLDVYDRLAARVAAAEAAGIDRQDIAVDPGIGFGKTLEHNLTLMSGLGLFHGLRLPVVLGASRKRFLGTLSGVEEAGARQFGSVAAALAGAAQGVQIVRVHDVAETRAALAVWQSAMAGTVVANS
jgi:dihydropteroate synthase